MYQKELTIQCVFMSFMVFGGASQLMAVTMLASGAGILQIIIATFAINFRHFVMGMSVINKLKHIETKWNLLLLLLILNWILAM